MLCVCWVTPNFWENALIGEKNSSNTIYNYFSAIRINFQTLGNTVYTTILINATSIKKLNQYLLFSYFKVNHHVGLGIFAASYILNKCSISIYLLFPCY